MSLPSSAHRRRLILSAAAATAAGLSGWLLPGMASAQAKLRTTNASALAPGQRVMLGSVALACLTDRKRQILVGGGFRSLGNASSNVVQTTLSGLSADDYQAAADAAYAAALEAFGARGLELVDNTELVALLKGANLLQANGAEYGFAEGGRQSSKAAMVGASAFGGYVPLPGWTPTAPGLAGLASLGVQAASRQVDTLLRQHAAAKGVAVVALLIGVSPVRIEASFGSDWRVPDAFGQGGLTRTGTLSTETGLSSHPLLTRMAVYPTTGSDPGEVAMQDEIGVQGGVGTLSDTTSGVVKGVQAVGNVLSMLGGSGSSAINTSYTLTADPASYVAGTRALSHDVVTALAGGLS